MDTGACCGSGIANRVVELVEVEGCQLAVGWMGGGCVRGSYMLFINLA